MSFSFDRGEAICILKEGKLNNEILYLIHDSEKIKETEEECTDTRDLKLDSKLQILPQIDENIGQRVYVSGPTGSGKSTWTSKYAVEYKKLFPKNPIFLFSKLTEDKSLYYVKPTRIKMDEELLKNPIDINELHDALVIFDDDSCVKDKRIVEKLHNLKEDCLKAGRHQHLYMICTEHKSLGGKKTIQMFTDSDLLVVFPGADSNEVTKVLRIYGGLNKDQIKSVFNSKSRWCAVRKVFPKVCFIEKGAFFI